MEISNISKNHNEIKDYLQKKYVDIINKYKDKENIKREDSNNIWICWWQGMENAPDVVKLCFEKVKKFAGSRKVILITKENYKQYVDIPNYIIEKVNKGVITITHLSDILRMNLLSEHGGIWLDATCFLTDNIFNDLNLDFYTIKLPHNENEICVSDGRWCGFFMSGTKNNVLFDFAKEFFNEYWKNENSLIDYFLIDYTIAIAYDNIKYVKQMIDKVPENNILIHKLKEILNEEFDEKKYEELLKSNKIHKLAHERKYITNLPNGKRTFYGYINLN